jgi:hypothetical protein
VGEEVEGRVMSTSMGRSALGLAVSSAVIFVLGLTSGWEAAEWVSFLAGLWVGFFLAWGAFWLFGWGRWAARAIYLWGIVGVVLLLVALYVAGSMIFGVLPNTPAVTISFWTTCGLVLGIVTSAGGIERQAARSSNAS